MTEKTYCQGSKCLKPSLYKNNKRLVYITTKMTINATKSDYLAYKMYAAVHFMNNKMIRYDFLDVNTSDFSNVRIDAEYNMILHGLEGGICNPTK